MRDLMDDEQDLWARKFLEPLRAQSSEAFIQAVMRRVRSESLPEAGIRWAVFARWAYPALAVSISGFAAAMLYTVPPSTMSSDVLLMGDRDQTLVVEWLNPSPDEDQILD